MKSTKTIRGLSLISVVMALSAVAGLSVVVVSLVESTQHSQANLALANTLTDLESRFRAAALSSAALIQTKAANPTLANCVDDTPACTTVGAEQDLELHAASGAILVPRSGGAPVYVNDNGVPCARNADSNCQWRVSAKYVPKDAAGQVIEIRVNVAWEKPLVGADKIEVTAMKGRALSIEAPKALFSDAGTSGTCGSCDGINTVISGLDATGCPKCVANPLTPLLAPHVCPAGSAIQSIDMKTHAVTCIALPTAAAAPSPPAVTPPSTAVTPTPPATGFYGNCTNADKAIKTGTVVTEKMRSVGLQRETATGCLAAGGGGSLVETKVGKITCGYNAHDANGMATCAVYLKTVNVTVSCSGALQMCANGKKATRPYKCSCCQSCD